MNCGSKVRGVRVGCKIETTSRISVWGLKFEEFL